MSAAVNIVIDESGLGAFDNDNDADAQSQQPDATFDRNLAEDMDTHALAALASTLLDGVDSDLQSRAEWEETTNRAAKYLGIKLDEPTASVAADGTMSKAISTCMLEAQLNLWSTARAELLPVGGPVKTRRDDAIPGPDQDTLMELADALATDLNHYLTVTDKSYYPDFSRMLSNRVLIGNAYRKVYRCPLKRRPRSAWVKGTELIVSNDCSALEDAGRITERIRYRQATMKRLQVKGHYLDVPLAMPTGQVTNTETAVAELEGVEAAPALPEDFEHLVYEIYTDVGSGTTYSLIGDLRRLDRDETGTEPGYPLPYRVSIDVDSRMILEIRRDWKRGDADHGRRRRYVKYGYIPNPTGGFYDIGLIHMAGNPTLGATMILRAGTDNALYNNFPAFVQLKGVGTRLTNTVLRPNPGEVVPIDAGGAMRVSDAIMPFPTKPLTGESMAMIDRYEQAVNRIAGILQLPLGEGRIGNTPVGTIMAYVEAVSQVRGAVHKDDHIAQQEEFELLRDLFVEEPDALIYGNRTPAREQWTAEELADADIVPAADPNTPSQVHRLMNAQARVATGGLPQFQGIADNRAIYREVNAALGGAPGAFELPPQAPHPPPPDPRVQAAQINAQAKVATTQAQQQTEELKHDERMAEITQEGQQREADRQSAETRAAMGVDAARVKAGAQIAEGSADRAHEGAIANADRAHEAVQNHADRTQPPQPPFAGSFAGNNEETPQ